MKTSPSFTNGPKPEDFYGGVARSFAMSISYLSTIVIAAAISVSAGSSVAKQFENESKQEHGASYQRLAETQGMDRRDDRRDVRQDARQEEGVVGKDKRDAKQEGRQETRDERQGGDDN
jgi:hypothetical protein